MTDPRQQQDREVGGIADEAGELQVGGGDDRGEGGQGPGGDRHGLAVGGGAGEALAVAAGDQLVAARGDVREDEAAVVGAGIPGSCFPDRLLSEPGVGSADARQEEHGERD